jgi:carbon monoxide dehydrogenase subunit G
MASIQREVHIKASADQVWNALRDVGALHTRLCPGFVTDTRMEGDSRWVTFGNGMVVRELIVDVDDTARRVAWSAVGEPIVHHNASAQVFPAGDNECRFVWIADLLPNELAARVTAMIEAGLAATQSAQEAAARGKNKA